MEIRRCWEPRGGAPGPSELGRKLLSRRRRILLRALREGLSAGAVAANAASTPTSADTDGSRIADSSVSPRPGTTPDLAPYCLSMATLCVVDPTVAVGHRNRRPPTTSTAHKENDHDAERIRAAHTWLTSGLGNWNDVSAEETAQRGQRRGVSAACRASAWPADERHGAAAPSLPPRYGP